jgi:hypothetical protein
MVAPTITTRVRPILPYLGDGFRTLIVFNRNPSVELWEQTIQPPGMDGGEAVPTTTMLNFVWRTFHPRYLKTMTEMKVKCAYNPKIYVDLLALINIVDSITVRFSNHDHVAFWGFLQKVEPEAIEEGKQPILTATIMPTNTDPNTGQEEEPVFLAATGTGTYA